MYIHQITDKQSIDLSAISNQGKMEKRFDFIVKTPNIIYGIEMNFYGSGGSKLNETARSYKTLAQKTEEQMDSNLFGLPTEKVGQALEIILKKPLMLCSTSTILKTWKMV